MHVLKKYFIIVFMDEKPTRKVELKENADLQRYIKELEDDVKLTEYNLREKSLLCSSNWAKWLSYLFLEKENMQRIADAKQKLLKKKTAAAKSTDSVLRMKSEEKICESDETMKKLNLLSKQTQDKIDYIERALNILQNFGYQVKNVTDVLKLQMN